LLARVTLGVDLGFSPDRRDPTLRSRWPAPGDALLVHCGRLSAQPGRSLAGLAELRASGVPAVLAALLATADVALAPGPIETFGLAALEALASGTPVVVSAASALPEVIGSAGTTDASYGAAVRTLLERPERRVTARAVPVVGVGGRFLSVISADRATASRRT
jgi:alpha-1,6-mannosyltransferase